MVCGFLARLVRHSCCTMADQHNSPSYTIYVEIFAGKIFRGLAPKTTKRNFRGILESPNPTGAHVVECCCTRLEVHTIALLEASTCMETCWSPVIGKMLV